MRYQRVSDLETSLILPIHIHISGPARGYGVLVIVPCLPGHGTISRNLYELELDCLPRRDARVEKPIWIVWRQHGTNCTVPGRTPIAKFNSAAGKKDVVPYLCRRRVVNRERDRNQFCRKDRILNAVRNLAR